jgi:hypothetical protein
LTPTIEFFSGFDRLLEPIRGFRDLALREALLDRGDHAAHPSMMSKYCRPRLPCRA